MRDSWWESLTPALEKITVPMLVCASFSDANLHSIRSFRAFRKVGSADRFAYLHRGPKWSTFYGEEAKAALKTPCSQLVTVPLTMSPTGTRRASALALTPRWWAC